MSHSAVPPQGPNPRGDKPGPDYNARQALLIVLSIVGSLVFVLGMVALVGNARDTEDDDDPSCFGESSETSEDDYLDDYDQNTDEFGLDEETDDYDLDEETEGC